MKKLIGSLLAVTIVVSTATTCVFAAGNNRKFSDVTGSEYYAESAEMLSELDILAGYTDGSFGAEKAITRAEMAAIICRTIEKEDDAQTFKGITVFEDVDRSHWASGYINVVSSEGIVNGDGNGKFRPEDNVTYEEAIKMIVCALKFDVNIKVDPKDWSAGYIKVAQNKGITRNARGSKGKSSTRGDVAVMIHGAMVSDLAVPEASLESGEYVGEQRVLLTTETDDADIYYTTNGKTPSAKSTKYKKAITISDSCTLKAVTVKKGVLVSDIMVERYDILPETYSLTIDEDRYGDIIATEGEYEENSQIYLRAVPNDGYEFERWYSDNGGTFSNKRNSECTFTMPADDVVISAEFSKIVVEEKEETNTNTSTETSNGVENEESSNKYDTTDVVPTEKENNVVSYAPIVLKEDTVLKACAVKNGCVSNIVEYEYSINLSESGDFLFGDIYKDSNVNSKDAIKLSQYLAKWNIAFDQDAKNSADVFYDGAVNSKDAIKLGQYIAKWNVTLGK